MDSLPLVQFQYLVNEFLLLLLKYKNFGVTQKQRHRNTRVIDKRRTTQIFPNFFLYHIPPSVIDKVYIANNYVSKDIPCLKVCEKYCSKASFCNTQFKYSFTFSTFDFPCPGHICTHEVRYKFISFLFQNINTAIRKGWSYTSTPLIRPQGVDCNNFTFFFLPFTIRGVK